MRADMTLLSDKPMQAEQDQLSDLKVLGTWLVADRLTLMPIGHSTLDGDHDFTGGVAPPALTHNTMVECPMNLYSAAS